MTSATTTLQFLACLCTIFTGALISADHNPPVITGPLEIQLKAGHSLNITCTGDTNINWTYPSFNQDPPISSRIVRTDSVESEKYVSRLEISLLQYDDTGEFLCIYANQSRNNWTSVAVYVFVQDETHLFAALSQSVVVVVHGDRGVIPCRVTNPRINATLWKGSTLLHEGNELVYNPMEGFIVASVTVHFSGSFTCRASMNGRTEENGIFLYYTDNLKPNSPIITANHSNSYVGEGDLINVMLNDNLTLNCEVQITSGQVVTLEWTGVQTSDRVVMSAAVKQRIDSTFFTVSRNLTIYKIQNSDEKVYTCVVTALNRKNNSATVNVVVFNRTNVSLSAPKKFVQVEVGASKVFLSVYITSNSRANLAWLQNAEVISPTHERYKQSSRRGRALLKILRPVVSDTGRYTLWAMTKDMNASETITLAVNDLSFKMASNGRSIASLTEGGLFNGHRATYSRETHDLLKTMMQEARLTNFQQRQLDRAVKSGTSLPSTCNPTSSAKSRKPPPKKPVGKVLNPRNYSSHVRSKEAIEASGAYERESYHPLPLTKFGGFYEKDKQRLSNIMAFGQDIDPAEKKKKQRAQPQVEPAVEKEVDRFQELQEEIHDRRKFLNEMELLGQGDKYRGIIETEISQLVREMELIDERKNKELEQLLKNANAKNG